MPVQAPQWSEYLSCPVCQNEFEVRNIEINFIEERDHCMDDNLYLVISSKSESLVLFFVKTTIQNCTL